MKKVIMLFLLVMVLINPTIVIAAKKMITRYMWDTNVQAVATETSPWKAGANYAFFAPNGDIALSSSNTITGNIYAKTLTATNAVVINGNIILGGADVSFQSVTVNGSVCANGNLTMKQSTVTGDINAQGSVTMNSGTVVGSSVFANGKVALAENPVTVASAAHSGGNVTIADNCSANTVCLCSSCTLTITDSGKIKTPPATKGSCTSPLKCTAVTTPNSTTYESKYTATYTTEAPDTMTPTKTIKPGAHYVKMAYSNTTLIMEAGTCAKYGDSGCYYLTSPDKVNIPAFYAGQNGSQKLKLDFSKGEHIVVFADGAITWAGEIEATKDGTNWRNMSEYFTAVNKTDTASLAIKVYWEALAKKTYWETNQGFTIKTPSLPRHWLGTVLTTGASTAGKITIPDNTSILGAFATREGSISQNNTVSIYYVLADYARSYW